MHRYRTVCRWSGSTGEGYDSYNREHHLSAPPAQVELALSADPSFRGDASLLNPEQLLVMAASSCQLLSFLAVAARARIDVVSYEDSAEGEMPEGPDPTGLTRILLRPVVRVRRGPPLDRLGRLVEVAHKECYVANSLRTPVVVEPEFVVVD